MKPVLWIALVALVGCGPPTPSPEQVKLKRDLDTILWLQKLEGTMLTATTLEIQCMGDYLHNIHQPSPACAEMCSKAKEVSYAVRHVPEGIEWAPTPEILKNTDKWCQ